MIDFNETVIDHVNGNNHCGISTGERTMRNRLEKLAMERPDSVQLVALNEDGSVYYRVPWNWVSVRRPKKMNYTEEQRRAMAERLARNTGKE